MNLGGAPASKWWIWIKWVPDSEWLKSRRVCKDGFGTEIRLGRNRPLFLFLFFSLFRWSFHANQDKAEITLALPYKAFNFFYPICLEIRAYLEIHQATWFCVTHHGDASRNMMLREWIRPSSGCFLLESSSVKVLYEETWNKSIGDENIKALRVKSMKVLSKETRNKSTGDENRKTIKGKIHKNRWWHACLRIR